MKYFVITLVIFATSTCVRIETGEVGLRIGFDKQINSGELLPGSFNQTIIGEVLTFPVKDVSVKLEDMTPLAKDNSTMKDFDALIVYNINPQNVSDLYTTKNKSFHSTQDGDVYLMYNYVFNAARNAIYKSARKYEALDMNDGRPAMEQEIKELIQKTLQEEGLDGMVTISQVLIRNIIPADSVVASANELVRAKNEYKQKEVEVETAKKEAERIAVLNSNNGAIQYMDAQSRMIQANAMLEAARKGSLIIVPMGSSPMINIPR